MKMKLKAIISYLLVWAMIFSLFPAMPARAEEPYVVVGIQGNGGKMTVTDQTETWDTYGCSRGVQPGQTLREAGYASVEVLGFESDSTREFLGWSIHKGNKVDLSDEWTLISDGLLSTKEMLDYVIPESDTEIMFRADWSEGKGGSDDEGDLESGSTSNVNIQVNGGTTTVEYVWGNTEQHSGGFGSDAERGVSVAEGLNIKSMSDPVYFADRDFLGWKACTVEFIQDGDGGYYDNVQIEGTDIMPTDEMLKYVVPEYDIIFEAQWSGSDDDYHANIIFEGYGGTISFTESHWENDEEITEERTQDDFGFWLERRNDVTIGDQIYAQQRMTLTDAPVKEGAEFEGWLHFEKNEYEERVLMSEEVKSTEEILALGIPKRFTIFVAKWSDVELDEYLNSDGPGDHEQEGSVRLQIDGNDGEMQISYIDGEGTESRQELATGTEKGIRVKDAFGIDSFSGPVFWTDRDFLGWKAFTEVVIEEDGDSWTEWVPINDVGLLNTEEMLNYVIEEESLRFEAQWAGDYYNYYSDLNIDAFGGELTGVWLYTNEDGNIIEDGRFRMDGMGFPIRKVEDTIENHLFFRQQARLFDPEKEGAEFEGWLKFVVRETENGRSRTLEAQGLSTEAMLKDKADTEAVEVQYMAKWSDVLLDDYINMDDSNDNINPNVLEIEYWYFKSNGEYEYYPVAIDIDGETTYGEFLAAAEEKLPIQHYNGMECIGWEYFGGDELNLNAIAEGGWFGAHAQYKDDKTLVTVQFSYFDAEGETVDNKERVIVNKNSTYADVYEEVKEILGNVEHCEEYSFTEEWRPNKSVNDTISDDPYDYLKFEAVYGNMPVKFTYSYLENGVVKTKSVEAKVNGTEPTLKLLEQNIPAEIDGTDIEAWELFPNYEFSDWVSARYNDIWAAANYADHSPVFHSRVYLTCKDGEYADNYDEALAYVQADIPAGEGAPDYDAFEKELLDTLYDADVKKVGEFTLKNYDVHWRDFGDKKDLAKKGEEIAEHVFTYNYNVGVKFYVKAVYDKALVILKYPDGTVEKMIKETGENYTLPNMYKGQQVYWDQGIAFAGGNPVLGGETVEVESPFTSFTSIYRLNIKPLDSVSEDLGKTVQEVKKELESTAKEALGKNNVTTNYFDVSLDRTDYEGGWNELDSSEFPSMGYSLYLPYPKGADKNDNFVITHMITTDTHPVYEKGQVEVLDYVAADEGLLVTLYSMSPVGISVEGCTHNWDAGKVTKSPTCKETGEKLYTCKNGCGETKVEKIAVNSKNHRWDAGKVTKKATCNKAGTKTYTCTRCKNTKKVTIKALGHKYKITKTTKATTKKNGKLAKQCTVCKTKATETLYRAKTVSLSKTSFVYNGKTQKPKVVVKDSKGKVISSSNYKVSFSKGCKNVGTYKVTVKFKGRYSGTLTKTFKIKKAKQVITAKNFTKKKGDKAFSINAKRSSGGGKLTYKTSNKKIATVSSKGKVTIKKAGTVTITITAAANKNYNKATKKIKINVKSK